MTWELSQGRGSSASFEIVNYEDCVNLKLEVIFSVRKREPENKATQKEERKRPRQIETEGETGRQGEAGENHTSCARGTLNFSDTLGNKFPLLIKGV